MRLIVLGLLAFAAAGSAAAPLSISEAQALAAGRRLWKNECAGTVAGLTSWNAGEDFASLGIGHFIWYPAGRHGPFEESFPELLQFLQVGGVELPAWLKAARACPWSSRDEFLADAHGSRMNELRGLLARTVGAQARFSANRLQAALPKMVEATSGAERDKVRRQFYRVAASPNGVYALVDYVNFKGEGVLVTEAYGGRGWGLAQVLAGMRDDPGTPPGAGASREFAASAARVLSERVANSPKERHEARWLPGWKSRVQTYAAP